MPTSHGVVTGDPKYQVLLEICGRLAAGVASAHPDPNHSAPAAVKSKIVSRSAKGTQMTTTHGTSYALVPVSPVLGAEVIGIDLTSGVDDATAAALREDFWRHKVLVFRNQHLSPDAHVEAVRIFDEPYDHPLWLHRDPQNPTKFMFYERFRSQAALEEHLASPYFKAFVAYRAALNPDPVASIVITTWRSIA